jgi:hypothetical protein
MPTSKKFTAFGFLPFCVENNPVSLFEPYMGESTGFKSFDINYSSIDTKEKSMRFYWLLERLVVTTSRSSPQDSVTVTTELKFEPEPYQRVCPTNLISNGQLSHLISFLKDGETAIHIEAPLNTSGLSDITDEFVFFGLTTTNENWGYVFSPTVTYYDTTIPITFDDFTLYAKFIAPPAAASFDSITVDDYSFYEIESE